MSQPPRIIDMQLPLQWLLTSAFGIFVGFAAMVWSVASQSNKLDQLVDITRKLEKRADERENRVDTLKDAQYEQRNVLSQHGLRIDALERTLRK